VGGVIWSQLPIKITKPYLSIWGETAPEPGIIIRGSGISIEASHILLRHLKIRPGDDPRSVCCKAGTCTPDVQQSCTSDPGSRDGTNIWATNNGIENVVEDHLSIEWALDEGLSIAPDSYEVRNVTISNSIIASGLDLSIHPEASSSTDPGHSKGTLINGRKSVQGLSYIRNVLAHNADRNIRISVPVRMEYINNVVYNWARGKGVGRTIEAHNSSSNTQFIDLIGNTYIPGPDTFCPETMNRPDLCNPLPNRTDTPEARKKMHYIIRPGNGGTSANSPNSRYFFANNLGPTSAGDDWDIADNGFFKSSARAELLYPQNRASAPVAESGLVIFAGDPLKTSGARTFESRDSVDAKIIEDIKTGTGRIINCVADDGTSRCVLNAGGWPISGVSHRPLNIPANPMGDDDGDGYTNLENWAFTFSEGGSTPTPTIPTTTTTSTVTTTTFSCDLADLCKETCRNCYVTTTTRTTTTRTTTTKTSTTKTSTTSTSTVTTTTLPVSECQTALNTCAGKCEDCLRLTKGLISAYPGSQLWPCEQQLQVCKMKLCENCR
jgi:hypothetical protein